MSGVVLNKRRGGSAADDDDDIAGLLADDDEDMEPEAGYQLDPGRSGGFRAKDLLPGRRRNPRKPFTVVRSSGSAGQHLTTLILCLAFFGLGLTKALLEKTWSGSQDLPSPKTTSAIGYLFGFILGGFLYSHFSRFFIFTLSSVALGACLTLLPWLPPAWTVSAAVYSLVGVLLAVMVAGGSVICLDFWGHRCGPYMQALHFCLGLGLLTGPLLVEPVSDAPIPMVVQTALTKHMGMPSSSVSSSPVDQQPPTPKYDVHLRRRRSVDPLLLELFGPHPPQAKSRKKPTFVDGLRLDRSRNWEKVKVRRPPKEELVAQTVKDLPSTSKGAQSEIEDVFKALGVSENRPSQAEVTSKSPSLGDVIQEEMRELKKDIETSNELIRLLGSESGDGKGDLVRRKRSNLRNRNGGIFNRPRIPGRYPSRGEWQNPDPMYVDEYEQYDQLGPTFRRGQDPMYVDGPGLPAQNPAVDLDHPPEKVLEAEKTLINFMTGKNISDDTPSEGNDKTVATSTGTSTTPTTPAPAGSSPPTTATSTRSAVTATATSSPPSSPSFPSPTVLPGGKKPLSSNTSQATLTIGGVLNDYGVSKPKIGFILDAVYTLLLSLLLMVCLCYHPRQPPRSRLQQAEEADSSSRIFKCSLTLLLFCFTLLHWGMFFSLRQSLPNLDTMTDQGSTVEWVFVGVFTGTRFLCCFCSAGILSPAIILFGSLLLVFAGSLTLVVTAGAADGVAAASDVYDWAGIVLQAAGLSTLMPTSLIWGESYLLMTPHVVSIICSAMAFGELAEPMLFQRLTLEAKNWLGFSMLGTTTLCLGLLVCVFLVARRRGRRLPPHATSAAAAAGYELANQDELNQELMDDDDDDDFEVSDQPPTLRLKSVSSNDGEA